MQWASLCNAFLVEAKWVASGQMPNVEEYLKNGIISSGVHVVLVHTFFFMGHGINKESVDIVNHNPGIITSVATILRLSDDLGSATVWFLSENEKTLLFQCKPPKKIKRNRIVKFFADLQ